MFYMTLHRIMIPILQNSLVHRVFFFLWKFDVLNGMKKIVVYASTECHINTKSGSLFLIFSYTCDVIVNYMQIVLAVYVCLFSKVLFTRTSWNTKIQVVLKTIISGINNNWKSIQTWQLPLSEDTLTNVIATTTSNIQQQHQLLMPHISNPNLRLHRLLF